MAKTEHYYTQFEEGHFYHVYNRTVSKQPMFMSDENRLFFLKKYDEYLSAVIETFAYCLLGNHFHFLIRIKPEIDITAFQKKSPYDENPIHTIVSHSFRKFFQSYAMAFNKQQKRAGTLFQTPFKRALINNDAYFTQLVYYIHANPQHHNLTTDFREWKWSSYNRILLDKPSKLNNKGLWGYSRHLNYFFEWLMWVSYFVFALASLYGYLAIINPAIILYLLLKVTGIPMTE